MSSPGMNFPGFQGSLPNFQGFNPWMSGGVMGVNPPSQGGMLGQPGNTVMGINPPPQGGNFGTPPNTVMGVTPPGGPSIGSAPGGPSISGPPHNVMQGGPATGGETGGNVNWHHMLGGGGGVSGAPGGGESGGGNLSSPLANILMRMRMGNGVNGNGALVSGSPFGPGNPLASAGGMNRFNIPT